MQPLIHHLRRHVQIGATADLSDGVLLERFVDENDELAFEQLVRRRGRMVLGLCRRVVRDEHLAEDAFQATFLTLAQKAATINRTSSVASWLYKVAWRIALHARRRVGSRVKEQSLIADVPAPGDGDVERRDLRHVLDEEIGRLPEKHRAPIVLCYLEGKTNAEVAREIGCPKGTLQSRLARARDQLRGRLMGRGIALSGAAFASCLCASSAIAVPRALVEATFQAARSGTIPSNVTVVMRGGMGMLSGLKTKLALCLLVVAGLTAAGVARLAGRAEAAPDNVKLKTDDAQKNGKLQPGPGLIGRTTENGNGTDLVFRYHHGKVFHPTQLIPRFGKPPRKVALKITFNGVLELNEAKTVHVYHSGGSSSHGHSTLWFDGKNMGKIGDDSSKNAMHELKLEKGSYQVTWVLTGGYFGCALLKFQDAETKKLLTLRFTSDDLKDLKGLPLKKVTEISSDKRGWPIRKGW